MPFDRNAAMDGYALSSREMRPDAPFSLALAGTSWAGKPYTGEIGSGQCVRIFTGAAMPAQADSVVMQEMVRAEGDVIHFPAALKPCQNVRAVGEDVEVGGLLCPRGKRLAAADIGLLVSAGVDAVLVHAQPNIAYFATGDELLPLNEPLVSGKIYNSNSAILQAFTGRPALRCG